MSDLRELYQEVILDHYRSPRNQVAVASPTASADGHNPLCGDRVQVSITLEEGVIQAIGFEGAGCAISTASASLMTEAVKGIRVEEAQRLFQQFQGLVKGDASTSLDAGDRAVDLGKLEVLAGVRDYPVRIKCATLAWHTLQAALDQTTTDVASSEPPAPVTTEA